MDQALRGSSHFIDREDAASSPFSRIVDSSCEGSDVVSRLLGIPPAVNTPLVILAAVILGLAVPGSATQAQAQCGGDNQRPCRIVERIPSCDKGLVEDVGKGKCLKPAAAQVASAPSVPLPTELDRVLRDYERAWQARDAAALAALFTEDGMTLSSGLPLRRGRSAIQQGYATSGGPLSLRAVSYATDDTVGYIIGGYSEKPGQPDIGKFVLALRRSPGGPWRIAADIDNSNQPPRMRSPGADSVRRPPPAN